MSEVPDPDGVQRQQLRQVMLEAFIASIGATFRVRPATDRGRPDDAAGGSGRFRPRMDKALPVAVDLSFVEFGEA